MLPHDQRILLKSATLSKGGVRLELEHQPAHVSVKEPLGDAVRIFIVIDMLMVSAMFAGPEEHGVFKGARRRKST